MQYSAAMAAKGGSSGVSPNATDDAFVAFREVALTFTSRAQPVPVLNQLDFSVGAGSFTAIIGPSGCGKTTILNLLAGIIRPTSGEVLIQGRPPGSSAARAGYMISRDALMPWRTVQSNVELPMELHSQESGHSTKSQRHDVARELLTRVGLQGQEHLRVKELSHGMRQRVALARLLAFNPDILLLDEPFSALDAQTRMRAQEFFLEVWQRDRKTVMLVTHDIQEALFMADEIIVFSQRPATIVDRFAVTAKRPRSIELLRLDHEFNMLYDRVWHLLKQDVTY